MLRIFFIITILLTNFCKYTAQVMLKGAELKKISELKFSESIYYKTFKSEPIIKTHFISAKSIDGDCMNYISNEYLFKKEKIEFIFRNENSDTVHNGELVDIYIKGKNNSFVTEDSIKIGDKVPISLLCKDIEKLKKNYISHNTKYLVEIFHNGVYYEFKKISPKEINIKTILTIKKINIRPYSISPNY
ncbi:MAG: hypothetical protein H7202_03640 [Pedobacter sp.]|nr:hypothetical protein [Pedobacter sp.]